MERRLPDLGNNYQAELERLERRLKELGTDSGIYLYGSRIFGSFTPESDLDVFVRTRNILPEEMKAQLRREFFVSGLGVVLYSEENFDNDRSDFFFDSPAFESTARTALGWNTDYKLQPVLNENEFFRQSWIWSMVLLRSLPDLSPRSSLKELFHSILTTWALERKISCELFHAPGRFIQALRAGDLSPDEDPLWEILRSSGVLSHWYPATSHKGGVSVKELVKWAEVVRSRLKKFGHILGELEARPISEEGVAHLRKNPLYSGIRWVGVGDKHWIPDDNGAGIIIKIKKLGWD